MCFLLVITMENWRWAVSVASAVAFQQDWVVDGVIAECQSLVLSWRHQGWFVHPWPIHWWPMVDEAAVGGQCLECRGRLQHMVLHLQWDTCLLYHHTPWAIVMLGLFFHQMQVFWFKGEFRNENYARRDLQAVLPLGQAVRALRAEVSVHKYSGSAFHPPWTPSDWLRRASVLSCLLQLNLDILQSKRWDSARLCQKNPRRETVWATISGTWSGSHEDITLSFLCLRQPFPILSGSLSWALNVSLLLLLSLSEMLVSALIISAGEMMVSNNRNVLTLSKAHIRLRNKPLGFVWIPASSPLTLFST